MQRSNAPSQQQQYPNWVFTVQYGLADKDQPTLDQAEALVQNLQSRATYLIYGKELAPTTGQPHLQGYLQLKKPARRTELVKLIPCFWEPARASDDDNYDYCSKSQDIVEFGERREVNPGRREQNRWETNWGYARRGEFSLLDPQIALQHWSNIRAIAKDFMEMPDGIDAPCGVWIYGEAGVGKSFMAREKYPDFYSKMCNKWWDGYKQEPNVIIDDFDKGHAVLGHHLKIWADSYPFIAEIKGGGIAIRPKTIVVTSQYSIEEIWADAETRDAIKRRFKVIRLGVPSDAPRNLRAAFNAPATPEIINETPVQAVRTIPRPPTQVIDLTQDEQATQPLPESSDEEEESVPPTPMQTPIGIQRARSHWLQAQANKRSKSH